MPFGVRKSDCKQSDGTSGGWEVYRKDTGAGVSCHTSEKDAKQAASIRERESEDMADVPADLNLTVDVKLWQEQLGENPPRRRFRMEAYSGATFERAYGTAVIDLAGIEIPSNGVPIFRDHNPGKFVGRSDAGPGIALENGGLIVAGTLFQGVQEAREVAAISDQGGRWQASVGISVDTTAIEFLAAEEFLLVNDREIEGPCAVLRKTKLREVSFVPVGADNNTSAIALSGNTKEEASDMPAPENKVDPVAEERARVKTLRKDFAHDTEFALTAIDEGLSPVEAKAAYADRLSEKLAAAQQAADAREKEWEEKLAAAEAAHASNRPGLAEKMGSSVGTVTLSASDDPVERWNLALDAESARIESLGEEIKGRSILNLSRRGVARSQAVKNLVTREPEMYQAYLEAYNSRGLGRRRKK